MSIHPYLAEQLGRSRQNELRHQASLRQNPSNSRRPRRSSRRLRYRLRLWPLETSTPRSAPAR